MGYVAATRIKLGDEKGGEYVEPGESVSEGDFSDKDWADMVVGKSVMEEDDFKHAYPELRKGVNQATGTPSNLGTVEGTTLQAHPPEPSDEDEELHADPAAGVNPADPPAEDDVVPFEDVNDSKFVDSGNDEDDES